MKIRGGYLCNNPCIHFSKYYRKKGNIYKNFLKIRYYIYYIKNNDPNIPFKLSLIEPNPDNNKIQN
jgi:hypothetical protein